MWGLKNFTSWKDLGGDKLVRMQVRPTGEDAPLMRYPAGETEGTLGGVRGEQHFSSSHHLGHVEMATHRGHLGL